MPTRRPKADAATKPAAKGSSKRAPLDRVLDQSQQVHAKVEQAAAGLSSVNAVLKTDMAAGMPLKKVEVAVAQSEAIEGKVQEAAEELDSVNAALAEEVSERHALEHRVADSRAALSQSRAQEERWRHDSLHDPATGLANLNLFNDSLRKAISQAQRHGWRLAVMFIDLDDFKGVNDNHGHDVGDQVLQMAARRLQGMVRGEDTVSRRGGDEFLFLMLEAKDAANAAELATRIAAKLAEPHDIGGARFATKASIGIAMYPEDGRSPEELLKKADLAMYAVKQQRKTSG